MWAAVATIAVPLIGFLASLLQKVGDRQLRRIAHEAELLSALKDAPDAHRKLEALLAQEVDVLTARIAKRIGRKINPGNVALATFLMLVVAVPAYFLAQWVISAAGTPFIWLAGPVAGAIGILLIIVAAAGFSTIYDAPKTQEERASEAAAKKLKREEQHRAREARKD